MRLHLSPAAELQGCGNPGTQRGVQAGTQPKWRPPSIYVGMFTSQAAALHWRMVRCRLGLLLALSGQCVLPGPAGQLATRQPACSRPRFWPQTSPIPQLGGAFATTVTPPQCPLTFVYWMSLVYVLALISCSGARSILQWLSLRQSVVVQRPAELSETPAWKPATRRTARESPPLLGLVLHVVLTPTWLQGQPRLGVQMSQWERGHLALNSCSRAAGHLAPQRQTGTAAVGVSLRARPLPHADSRPAAVANASDVEGRAVGPLAGSYAAC